MEKHKQVPFDAIDLENGFWYDRQNLNKTVPVKSVYERFMETGRFDSFKCDWKEGMPNKPHVFFDSDIAKWIESVAYILKKEENKELEAIVDDTIDLIEKNQQPNGYFNIWFTVVEPEMRFVRRADHELYCAGHLIEAAIAYYEARGKDKFLNLMRKYADYIARVFMQEQGADFVTPGHQEIELALVRLYRCTGEKRYLTLSKWFLDQRGANDKDKSGYYDWANELFAQDHLPVREQTTAEGHVVRAAYMYAAMADVAYETGDKALFNACRTIFRNIIYRRMYVTGSIGSSRHGEAFTVDYDLPNATAYAESCGAISLAMFARRMQQLEVDSVYGDIVELTMFNGILVSTSLDGKKFFYENPLEIDLAQRNRNKSVKIEEPMAITQRVEVFNCSCCPPNIARFIASLGDYLYTYGEDTIFVHQYMTGNANFDADGRAVTIRQETKYPTNGKIAITVNGAKDMTVGVRIPGWCCNFELLLGGKPVSFTTHKGYALVSCDSDSVSLELNLAMEPELLESSPLVHANAGRAALRRGPVVYCIEGVDNSNAVSDKLVDAALQTTLETIPGVPLPAIKVLGWQTRPIESGQLYRPLENSLLPCELTFIPYYTFANRGESDMLVWIPIKR